MASETCAEKQARLATLIARIRLFESGGMVKRVRDGNHEVEFGDGDLDGMRREYLALAAEVAACTGASLYGRRRIFNVTPVG